MVRKDLASAKYYVCCFQMLVTGIQILKLISMAEIGQYCLILIYIKNKPVWWWMHLCMHKVHNLGTQLRPYVPRSPFLIIPAK